MVERKVKINNQAGIHCRPSSVILMATQEFPGCQFHLRGKQGEACLDGILALLGMGLERGDEVTLRVTGEQEAAACAQVAELLAREFDFPQPEDHPAQHQAPTSRQEA